MNEPNDAPPPGTRPAVTEPLPETGPAEPLPAAQASVTPPAGLEAAAAARLQLKALAQQRVQQRT